MLRDEFIQMQRQDLLTSNNEVLKELLRAIEEVLIDYPATTEFDGKLTVENCYEKMKGFAKAKAVNGCYCVSPDEVKVIVKDYFGLTGVEKQDFVNLEDYI